MESASTFCDPSAQLEINIMEKGQHRSARFVTRNYYRRMQKGEVSRYVRCPRG